METENQLLIENEIESVKRIYCNVVMPLSGHGKRFLDQGFIIPKSYIDIFGPPMFWHAFNSLGVSSNKNIFILQPDHIKKRDICGFINGAIHNTKYVWENPPLQGPAHSVSLANEFISDGLPLVICNGDHKLEWDGEIFLKRMKDEGASGGVVSFYCSDEKDPIYSYLKLDENGRGIEITEKQKISNYCCSGIYIFADGLEYMYYYNKIVEKNRKVNGEFYVSTVLDEMIKDGKLIINTLCKKYQSFGTPEELYKYMNGIHK